MGIYKGLTAHTVWTTLTHDDTDLLKIHCVVICFQEPRVIKGRSKKIVPVQDRSPRALFAHAYKVFKAKLRHKAFLLLR